MYMLDTNICIYVLNRRSRQLRHKFKAVKELCISSVTYAELCFGVENGPAALKGPRWDQLQGFASRLLVLPLDDQAGECYGRLRAHLRRQGTPIGNNDLFIAAHALSLGVVLVSNNTREFSRVPDLSLENWV